jgi:hypothetical protein
MGNTGIGKVLPDRLMEVYCDYCKNRLSIEGINWEINFKVIEFKCSCGQKFTVKKSVVSPNEKIPALQVIFHNLWTKAVGKDNYDKKEWQLFQRYLRQKGINT